MEGYAILLDERQWNTPYRGIRRIVETSSVPEAAPPPFHVLQHASFTCMLYYAAACKREVV